jgi:hypothetical protein
VVYRMGEAAPTPAPAGEKPPASVPRGAGWKRA